MKTKAAVLRSGSAPFSIEELELGEPNADEVLIEMVAAGMCHTDLLSRELPPEFFGGATVYGHEGAGIVREIGANVGGLTVGDHVVLSFTSCRDRHENRLVLAERYGATDTVVAAPDALGSEIMALTRRGADYAFDTTGNATIVRGLFEGLNNIGTLAVAGVGFGDVTFDYLGLISGRSITGVMEGDSVPSEFIPKLAALNQEGKFPYDELITTFAFDEINQAEAASSSGEVIKPVLVF